ncbi:unnamed protein product [Trichogramma brassicae]|uniref:Reverse transcriptase domain-containing protein n=1 Tax=Trichogramma brassicae TaxID=86971 RepID=A0A6H5IXI8_9HYME|nr:unnamed protein product [Trichogramma brassicae]
MRTQRCQNVRLMPPKSSSQSTNSVTYSAFLTLTNDAHSTLHSIQPLNVFTLTDASEALLYFFINKINKLPKHSKNKEFGFLQVASTLLLRIITSYFNDRVLECSTNNGAESRDITMDVLQRSVPSPILWNDVNNKILKLKLLDTMYVVGFANDIVLTVVIKQLENRNKKK